MYIQRLNLANIIIRVMLVVMLFIIGIVYIDSSIVYASSNVVICPVLDDVISEKEVKVNKSEVNSNANITQIVEEVNQSRFYELILNEECEDINVSSDKGYINFAEAVTKNILYDIPYEKQIAIEDIVIKDKVESMSIMTINEYNLQIKYGITEDDLALFERIIQAEAGNQDLKGKILVANVILNRIKSSKFPNNIRSVIMARGQFQPVSSGRIWSVRVSDETREAARRALDGEDYSMGALYFMARSASYSSNITWFDTALTRLFKHGGHEFFK